MRTFIAKAQQFEPVIPHTLHNYIVAKYVEKRKIQRDGLEEQSYMYVTPRTLLAIIRLAQAMAKLQFRNEVSQSDVDEAIKLMDYSIRSLQNIKAENKKEKKALDNNNAHQDQLAKIIENVRNVMEDTASEQMNEQEIFKLLNKMHHKVDLDQLRDALNHYRNLNVVFMDENRNVIFV